MYLSEPSTERWKTLPGFELRYLVSDQGRVLSFVREWKILKPSASPSGHLTLYLQGGIYKGVHELVLLAFVGPRPPKMEARHLNGIPSDNRLSNLEWNTRSRNNLDRRNHKRKVLAWPNL